MKLNLHDCEFMLSAVNESQYPAHELPEIALVGRSNVGKSSLINAVVNRRKLARTSGQPGRTQTLNFYRIDRIVLVDLPGYGFAKVPEHVRQSWQGMIEGYLMNRQNLKGVIQLVDMRHKPTNDDQMMCSWLRHMEMPFFVVATKADKISRGKQARHLKIIRETLGVPAIAFSAETRLGVPDVLRQIGNLVQDKQEKENL